MLRLELVSFFMVLYHRVFQNVSIGISRIARIINRIESVDVNGMGLDLSKPDIAI